MSLIHRQQKIQEKRKQTPRRNFLKEIGSWFNVMLYKTDQGIGRYSSHGRYKNILTQDDFFNAELFSLDIDHEKNFFKTLGKLFMYAPKLGNLSSGKNENSSYTESAWGAKNAYLSIELGMGVENILYSIMIYGDCRNVINSLQVTDGSHNIYYSKSVDKGFNIFYSKYIHNASNIRFSSNCVGCEECIQCNDLTNKKYCIENIQYDKQKYLELKKEIIPRLLKAPMDVYEQVSNTGLIRSSSNCSGAGMYLCSDIDHGYNILRMHTGRNILFGDGGEGGSRNFYDCFHVGEISLDFYGVACCGISVTSAYCSVWIIECSHVYYCYHLVGCSYCLGCIGLKNKQFCIFNKQYTKEERYQKVDGIFSQMEREGTLGDFFPGRMNPFYFNDTAAYLIDDSFTKEEVEAEGYLWRDEEVKVDIPKDLEVVGVDELRKYEGRRHPELDSGSPGKPGDTGSESGMTNFSWRIDPEILKKVIRDEKGNYYRIVKMEYDFLLKHGLPLPRLHWLDRLKMNFKID